MIEMKKKFTSKLRAHKIHPEKRLKKVTNIVKKTLKIGDSIAIKGLISVYFKKTD